MEAATTQYTRKRVEQRAKQRHGDVDPKVLEQATDKTYTVINELEQMINGYSNDICVVEGSMVDLGNALFIDIVSELKRRKQCKFEVKKLVNQVMVEYDALAFTLHESTRANQNWYADILDVIEESVEQDMLTFKYSIKQVLDKFKVKDSDFVADFIKVKAMFDLAEHRHKAVIEASCKDTYTIYNKHNIVPPSNLTRSMEIQYSPYTPVRLHRAFCKLCDAIFTLSDECIKELNGNKNLDLCIAILQRKLCNSKTVEANMIKAKELQ